MQKTGPDMASPHTPNRIDALTFVLHWGAVLALLLSLATGWRIASMGDESAMWRWLEIFMMQGNVLSWHFSSALALAALVGAYLVFLVRARLGGRWRMRAAAWRSPDRETRWRVINKALYWLLLIVLGGALASGAWLYFFPGAVSVEILATAHQWLTWSIVAYAGLHVLAQALRSGWRAFLPMLMPRRAYGAAAIVALSGGAALAGAAWLGDAGRIQTLDVARIAQPPLLDGDPSDDVWRTAREARVTTARGHGLQGGESTVRVSALHDGEHAYFLFRWRDPTRSQKHIPLVKTAQGWKLMQSRYGTNDELDYYEDKFAVMLSRSATAGGDTVHLGSRPLPDKPGPSNRRGLHYSASGDTADVWHWKGVRSAATRQFDDNYFGAPMPEKPGKRYTGGYNQDPKTGGGFEDNYVRRLESDLVEVKFLPRDLAALRARMGRFDPDPDASDADGAFALHKGDAVPYDAARDAAIPVGTVIPAVLFEAPFSGDRGDVSAHATWQDGEWRLEARRKIDTGSRFDQPIADGMYMWLAVFDHNQVRHTRHSHPLRIQLQ